MPLREKIAAAFSEGGGGVGAMSSREKSPYYGALQQVVDSLFADLTEEERIADMAGVPGARKVRRLDVILAAEAVDLPDELQEIVNLLPPSTFTRRRLCDQLNSAGSEGMPGGTEVRHRRVGGGSCAQLVQLTTNSAYCSRAIVDICCRWRECVYGSKSVAYNSQKSRVGLTCGGWDAQFAG